MLPSVRDKNAYAGNCTLSEYFPSGLFLDLVFQLFFIFSLVLV